MAMNEKDIDKLIKVEGIQEATARKVLEGLQENRGLIEFLMKKLKMVKKKEGEYNIVFTNVRNKEFERHLEEQGFEIGSSVNKKTKYVITESKDTVSGKTKKADELGIPKLDILTAYKVFNFV